MLEFKAHLGNRSYQLTADIPTGGVDKVRFAYRYIACDSFTDSRSQCYQGALVHFNESTAGENKTTSTPWIAFISCDFNETNASDYWGTFSLELL
jgi:hypothetical protein